MPPDDSLDLFPSEFLGPDATPIAAHAPLAERMRPRNLDEVLGQDHLLGRDAALRSLAEAHTLPSMILWGPPGCGKTTLARLLAAHSGAHFESLSAVMAGVKEIREVVQRARRIERHTVLFLDELHRLNRAQQDSLLPHVETGVVTLIGATTENPSFEINAPLLSRCRVFTLSRLDSGALESLIRRAAIDEIRGLGKLGVTVEDDALAAIAHAADGDARRALGLLEAATAVHLRSARSRTARPGTAQPGGAQPGGTQSGGAQPGGVQPGGVQPGGAQSGGAQPGGVQPGGVQPGGAQSGGAQSGGAQSGGAQPGGAQPGGTQPGGVQSGSALSLAAIEEAAGRRLLLHDRDREEHYNVVSALIKSLRASDPDAALYYAARMLEAGEDPLFVARRLVIFASEDVGNADPQALGVATSAYLAVERIGMPEGRIPLGQAVTFLACAPKSNASYLGINRAIDAVREHGSLPVPLHLRNAPTSLMKGMGYGRDYVYPHNTPGQLVAARNLPEELAQPTFYEPNREGAESEIARRLADWRQQRRNGNPSGGKSGP